MTVSETSRRTSIEILAGHRAAVHWYPALLSAFHEPEDQRKIVGMMDAAMREFNTLVFYVHYTDVGNKEITWNSDYDEETDRITVEVDLSERFQRDEEGNIVLGKMEMAFLQWLNATDSDPDKALPRHRDPQPRIRRMVRGAGSRPRRRRLTADLTTKSWRAFSPF